MSDRTVYDDEDGSARPLHNPRGDIMELEQQIWEIGRTLERIEDRIESISCIVTGIATFGAVFIVAVGILAAMSFETALIGEIWNGHGQSPWSVQGILSIVLTILIGGAVFFAFVWSIWKAIDRALESAGIAWTPIKVRLGQAITRKKPSKAD